MYRLDPTYTGPVYLLHVHVNEARGEEHYTFAFYNKTAVTDMMDMCTKIVSLPTFSYCRIDYYPEADLIEQTDHDV